MTRRRWDLFCRVVDNLGDAGVCWRLAADLAARGVAVRLVIDDTAPLARIAPQGAAGVEVCAWPGLPGPPVPADVVVEAFGCDPPPDYVATMREQAGRAPLWINLEYLSAESYVERSHRLPSPQPGGLVKHFFYPGFTRRTGGLLREPGMLAQRARFDGLARAAWLQLHDIQPAPRERLISLFCYDNPLLADLLRELAHEPTLLLLTPGPAQRQFEPGSALAQLAASLPALRLQRLQWLPQPDFDRLLWSCDFNLVRGEDSLVRAIWAGAPFVWQAYPQHDGAQFAKIDALLARMGASAPVAALWRAWNSAPGTRWPGLAAAAQWQPWLDDWRAALVAQDDLATQLLAWAEASAASAR